MVWSSVSQMVAPADGRMCEMYWNKTEGNVVLLPE